MENPREDQEGGSRSDCSDATLAYPELVPIFHDHDRGLSTGFSGRASSTAQQTQCEAPSPQEPESSSASLIRKALKKFQLCELSEKLIMASWRNNTQKRYVSTLKKWDAFCQQKHIDPIFPDLRQVIHFLTLLFKEGGGHRAICAARSALNAVIHTQGHTDISMHPLLTRFCKGVFNIRPPPMKLNEIWDPRILLDFINNMEDNPTLTMQQLTHKTVGLLMLLSGSRVHCIHAFSTFSMTRSEGCYTSYPQFCLSIHAQNSEVSLSLIDRTHTIQNYAWLRLWMNTFLGRD